MAKLGLLSEIEIDLGKIISALNSDFSALSSLIRPLDHTISCNSGDVEIRAHYLPFRNGKPMTAELLESIRVYICNFALSRSEIDAVHESVRGKSPQDAMLAYVKLQNAASDLFIKAQKSTNRNGECGELLLYLLIEWILEAPQILAKMPLKTNVQMPVHGSDGIHIKYDAASESLMFLWGEAKLHKTINGAINSAVASIADALQFSKMKQDISLIKRNFDLSGFPQSSKDKILEYLDPLHSSYHKKIDVSACLIGFDYDAFGKLGSVSSDNLESTFCDMLKAEIDDGVKVLESSLDAASISHHRMEVFFLPFVSVDQLRKDFQNLIGWKE